MATAATITGTIAGYFSDNDKAARAVEALKDAGFNSAHLGIASRGYGSNDSNEGESTWDKIKDFFGGNSSESYAKDDTRGGLAAREGTSTHASGNAYGDYDNDDVSGNLSGLSVDENRSKYFGHKLNNGKGTVVTVNAGDRAGQAESIMLQYGADLGEGAEGYDYSQTTNASGDRKETNDLQLLGEVLRVQKERVSRGEVTLRKEVITEMQTIQVPVSREELVIERHAVDGGQTAQGTVGKGEEIRIPLSEERASLGKQTVVREEVSVGKRTVESVRELTGEVKHEDLVVNDTTK